MGTTDEQLARSYSFELRPNNFLLPSMDDNISPAIRYPTSQKIIRQNIYTEKPSRSSSINVLVNSAMIGSQVSLTNRKVDFH
jgi:hypothetical protein